MLSIGALAALALQCSSDKSKDSGNAGSSGAQDESGGASNSSGASSTDAGKTSSSKGGGNSSSGGKTNSTMGGSATTSGGKGSAGGATGSAQGGHTAAGAGNCLAQTFLNKVNSTRLLVGASMSDDTAAANPYTLRYLYLSGGFPDGAGPCTSCTSCTTAGTTCANPSSCSWWGCWQYDQNPPGEYARDFIKKAEDHGQIAMVTIYEILQASGASEGAAEVTAVNDLAFMKRYWPNWKFMLMQMGDKPSLLHVEPDFWGYAEQTNADPSKIPAAVASANSEDCGDKPNTLAGMGACLVSMARKYSPSTLISLHASGWATGNDVLRNTSASLDVAAEGTKLGKFLAAVAPDADFITADISDRDAGFYETQPNPRNTWLDDTNQKLPDYHQVFTWAKAVTEAAGKPVLWWQVPVGNMSLNNTMNMYKDNAVDYLMSHLAEVAAANGVGVAFGAGDGNTTTPETDGGNLNKLVKAYAASAGQAPCP